MAAGISTDRPTPRNLVCWNAGQIVLPEVFTGTLKTTVDAWNKLSNGDRLRAIHHIKQVSAECYEVDVVTPPGSLSIGALSEGLQTFIDCFGRVSAVLSADQRAFLGSLEANNGRLPKGFGVKLLDEEGGRAKVLRRNEFLKSFAVTNASVSLPYDPFCGAVD